MVETLTSSASMSNKIKFTVTGASGVASSNVATASGVSHSTISSSSHLNNNNNSNNNNNNGVNPHGELIGAIKNREDLRSSIHSHATNQYASEKVLPLTVACHFKVNYSLKDSKTYNKNNKQNFSRFLFVFISSNDKNNMNPIKKIFIIELTTRTDREDQQVQSLFYSLHQAESDSRESVHQRVCGETIALL